MTITRFSAENSVLVVIDIQDKLLAKIPTASALVQNTAFLLDAANLVNVPVLATEQYPKGLGPTTDKIRQRLSGDCTTKTAFSSCGAVGFLDSLRNLNRECVVLAGMETHVCVMQTALDLLVAGFRVILPVDALASRNDLDKEMALHRLDRAGATLTTVEAVGFEWFGDSKHPQFKAFIQLVIHRTETP